MKNIFKKLATGILALTFGVIGSYALVSHGSTIPIAPSLFETSLSSPIGSTDTSMTLASGTLANGATLSGYACFTIDSGNPNVEFVCGTASNTSITSLLRGVDTLTGNTSVASLKFSHRRGSDVKITDFPVFSVVRNIVNGNDTLPNTITYATGVTPLNAQDLTTKAYVLSVVSGGTVSFSQVIVAGKAGETVSAGNVVYLNTDGQWWLAKGNDASKIENVQLGIAQGAGTAGNTISGGVLIRGTDTNNTGTAGNYAYVSDAGGAVGTSAGTYTRIVGQFLTASGGLYFNPGDYLLASGIAQGVYSSSNKLLTQDNVYTADTDQTQATQNSTVAVGIADTTTNLLLRQVRQDQYEDKTNTIPNR